MEISCRLFYPCTGILHYSNLGNYRLVVDIDPELGDYYRSLMPKYLKASPGRFPTHITVVRPEKDVPSNLSAWGKYEGQKVDFLYENEIVHGKKYFWLRALSKRLEEIRTELGLGLERSKTVTDASYDEPPRGYAKFWHITIANIK
jgi:hypothetical protein